MKKLLKKAMVFTLAAAMLVGTPLTASAAPLNSVYSIWDGTGTWNGHDSGSGTGTVTNTDTNSGALIEENDAKIIGIVLDKQNLNLEKGDKEPLKATVVLDGKIMKGNVDITNDVIAEMSKKIKWEVLYLDESGKKDTGKGDPTEKVGLELNLGKNPDRSTVQLNAKQGTKKGEEVTVRATIDSRYYYAASEDGGQNTEVKLNTSERPAPYTAETTVSVKEYSTSLAFDGIPKAYVKHTVDLTEYLVRTPATANDTITWVSDNTKVATVNAAGVVSYKKVNWDGSKYTQTRGKDDKCTITAVGEKGAKAVYEVKVEAGVQASKVIIVDDLTQNTTLGKQNVDLKEYKNKKYLWEKDVKAKAYAKVPGVVLSKTDDKKAAETEDDAKTTGNGKKYVTATKPMELPEGATYFTVSENGNEETLIKNELKITDKITWTVNKKNIVDVKDKKDGREAELKTVGNVGTVSITAKASSGKSAKLTVVVKATLDTLKIDGIKNNQTVHSGQSIQLEAIKNPAGSKDGVKWSIVKVQVNGRTVANPNATINSKGLLTIKPKVNETIDVTVHLESSKKVDKKPIAIAEDVTIKVKQSSIDGITVNEAGEPIAQVGLNNRGKIAQLMRTTTTEISIPKNKAFTATVIKGSYGNAENVTEADLAKLLTWKTSNAKVAEISGSGSDVKITAKGTGTATITVSGVRAVKDSSKDAVKSASIIKTTFKVKVMQPVETLTMNKASVTLAEKFSRGNTASQKVSLKVAFGPKKVNKGKEIENWTLYKPDGTSEVLMSRGKVITKTSVSVSLAAPKAGEVYKVVAKTPYGIAATSTIYVVDKTQGVQIAERAALDSSTPAVPVPFTIGNGSKTTKNAAKISIGDKATQMYPFVNVGKDSRAANAIWKAAGVDEKTEDVTYSVNKKGIVTVTSDGKIYGIKKGTVTITAKTPMGKKGTLKVTVE